MNNKTSRSIRNKTQRILLTSVVIFSTLLVAAVICFIAFLAKKKGGMISAASPEITIADDETASQEESTVKETEKEETTQNEPESVFVEVTNPEPVYVDLVAVGDNLIHKELDVAIIRKDGTYDFANVIAGDVASEISRADFAIINQEVPCAGNQYEITGYPTFNAPTEALDMIYRLGFDAVTLATNHALDMGEAGLVNTLNYLKNNYPDILTTGTFRSYEEYMTIPVKEVNGIRIAVLNYTYGTNGYPLPNEYSVGMLDDMQKISSDIRRAKDYADFIIVAPHWGNEYQLSPSEEQKRMAKYFADCGADLIIGAHPHVVQPMEWIEAADGREVLVYYSLGNFLSAQQYSPRSLGGMAKVRIVMEDGKVRITKGSIDFTVTYFTSNRSNPGKIFDDFKVYMLRHFPKTLDKTYGVRDWTEGFTIQDYYDYAKRIDPDWE